ncbi:MAG TPA: selenocysteine-specific translation elongation factor [Phycisphaerae bacterium]|nr:selenocysteine-specific translation elongation factor [Phycisphaerae bacterium]
MATAPASIRPPAARRTACILGTAGHIDHGKSSLVKALTGTDPDRLPEEKARGMTIELGFAHLTLRGAGGELDVGIVDVPGHERFVKTMVAGATGIDLGMLVVAADDGVMPQTREHVDILDLLGVGAGLIVINKSDVATADRIEEVRGQITELVAETALADWPIVASSARTGLGLDEIRSSIARLIADLPQRTSSPIFRLAIDRVFPIHGRGTVVTGSVLSGTVAPGITLELQPPGLTCKVREVQSHGVALHDVAAGRRCALNLTGIDREKIARGMELSTPGYLTPARYVDAQVRVLSHVEKPVRSHQQVRVSLGTCEEMATLVVFGDSEITPGGRAMAQFRFERPVVAAFGQRFILRNENAQTTLGGGIIVRPVSRRIRGNDAAEIELVTAAASPEPLRRYEAALRRAWFELQSTTGESGRINLRLSCATGLDAADLGALHQRLEKQGAIIRIDAGRVVHRAVLDAVSERALAYLRRHHKSNPNEPGVQRDRFVGWLEQRTAAGCGRWMLARLESAGKVATRGPYVAHYEFRPALSPEDADLLERAIREITAAGFDPPLLAVLKAAAGLSEARMKVLEDTAKCDPRVVQIAPQHFISSQTLQKMKDTVRGLGAGRSFKLAEVRDALGLSRRVVQTLLEHLDRVQFTKRVGDERVLLEAGQ